VLFTRRGWTLWLSSAAIIAAARLLGLPQLWIIACGVWLLLVGCAVWTNRHHIALSALRDIPEHLHVGSEGRVDLTVVNQGSTTSPTTHYIDHFDSGERSAQFALQPLAAGQSARAAYRVPTNRRGRFTLGPLVASIGDPFGIARQSWHAASAQEVIVHPRLFELLAPPEMSGTGLDAESRDVAGRPDSGGEFNTLRDYTASDDLRHVHWKSTARRGRMMVRQDQSRRRAPALIMIDTRAAAHTSPSFERAVEITASIAAAIARTGRPYEVITTAGEPLGQSGRRYLGSVLDELAVIDANSANRIVPALAGTRATSLIAIMGTVTESDRAAVELMVRRGGAAAIVLCHTLHPAPSAAMARRLTIDISRTDTLDVPSQWNQAVLAWQQNATPQYSQPR
jgi:uncharacterized protein (DUF58 family)